MPGDAIYAFRLIRQDNAGHLAPSGIGTSNGQPRRVPVIGATNA
jgi:hypothetical protein